jgi:hypothetical protein
MSVVLTVAIEVIQFILMAMGVIVSLKPPEQKYHKHWFGAFLAVGTLGIVVTAWLAMSSDADQKRFNGRLDQSLRAQESMRSQLTTITGMVSGLSENKSDPQLKQLATAIRTMAKANQKQESQLVPNASTSQSPYSGLAKEDLRSLVNDSTQLMFGLSKFWAAQIESADQVFEDMKRRHVEPLTAYGKGPMMTRLQFQRDIKPVLPKANDLRKEMLSRVSNMTEEDAMQSKWFANALQKEGVDPPDPDGVTKAANYLQNLAARMIR